MRRLCFSLVLVVTALAAGACGPTLADCDAIKADQPDCMNDATFQECVDANQACTDGEGNEVLVTEGCPLTFSCAQAP